MLSELHIIYVAYVCDSHLVMHDNKVERVIDWERLLFLMDLIKRC